MCGIFGILTLDNNINIFENIINGLIQLQNRGYDSTGLGFFSNNKSFNIYKHISSNDKTSIEKILMNQDKILIEIENKFVGIGHNRWATHGIKNEINAHPHTCYEKKFMIVHNGIIENYSEIKNHLQKNGYIFISQTDTEVIVNLINYYYKKTKSTFEAIKKAINELQGTYGIIVMHIEEPTTLYTVRNGSPILVGLTDNYAIITSEQSGFCNKVNNYITLNNEDICILNLETKRINMKTYHNYIPKGITIGEFTLTPEPYKYWIEKEIYEQSLTVRNAINMGGRIKNEYEVKLGGLEPHINILREINNIILLGCGTSYHSALYGMSFMKNLCNFDIIQVIDGADFSLIDIPKKGKTAIILISQSGETRDLYRCIEIVNENQSNNNIENEIVKIGIINVVDSLIAKNVDCGIYCNAGREMSVASTKVFTSQVICLSLLSIWFSQIHNINKLKRARIIKDLYNLSVNYDSILNSDIISQKIEKISEKIINENINNLFLLGKHTDDYVSREGSLKIKEISYVHSEAYSLSSLKHGPFALLDDNFPTIIIDTQEEFKSKVNNCIEEIYSRKSPIILISNIHCEERKSISKIFEQIEIPENKSFSSLLAIIPLQLLAFKLSIKKGINPDTPKNLAKVVTVE